MPDAFDHCEQLVREADKDRFLATLFAPQKHRRALFALYAFNLEVARVRELAREPMPGEIRLQWWRDLLGGAGHGDVSAHPVAAALRDTVVRYGLPPRTLADLIDARSFDLYDDPMGSLDELEGYARKTSSALMGLAARVLNDGRVPADASGLIDSLGLAVAMAGLLRALPLHASRGQLYLPLDVLARHGASPENVLAGRDTPELRAALAEMRLRVRGHLDAAREQAAGAPGRIAPALLPAALVRPALARMEARRYRPFAPDEIPQWRRQWTLWSAARRGLRSGF